MTQTEVLLIQDVEHLGRSGDLVKVRRGYARNYLLPGQHAVRPTKVTLAMQARLQAERAERAARELAEAQQVAAALQRIELKTEVKVDPEGHMYGSVAVADVVHMLAENGIVVERRHVQLPHSIKELGIHHIPFRLNEGVQAEVLLKILPEGVSEEQFFGAIAEQQEIHADPQFQDYYS